MNTRKTIENEISLENTCKVGESRLQESEGRCKIILKIKWEQRVTNAKIVLRTGISNSNDEVKKRRNGWGVCSECRDRYILKVH